MFKIKVIVQPLGLFKVLNNGSLIQISDGISNTGNIALERTTQLRLSDYVYWSSPVNNFPLYNVSPILRLIQYTAGELQH